MVRLVRHRQTKGPATDRLHLNHRTTSRLHNVALADRIPITYYSSSKTGNVVEVNTNQRVFRNASAEG